MSSPNLEAHSSRHGHPVPPPLEETPLQRGRPARFMVAIDDSEHARKAFIAAARAIDRDVDKLYLVAGVRLKKGGSRAMVADEIQEENFTNVEHARTNLARFEALGKKYGIRNLETVVLQDAHIKGAIAKWTTENNIDHLYIGTRDRSAVKRFFSSEGSFSKYLMDNVTCNVTVVRK